MNESDKKTIEVLKNRIHQLESELKDYKRAKKAVDAAGFDVWENNFVTGETYGSNRRLFENLGYEEDELPANLDETTAFVHPDDLPKVMQKVKEHFDGKTNLYQSEFRVRAKDGSWIWTGNAGKAMEKNEKGEVTSFVGLSFNVDEKRILEESMRELAYTDSLTKLGNRRILFETGVHEIERAVRYNHPLSLFLFDIDDFKSVNDKYGHLLGDEVLSTIADYLFTAIRQVDLKIRYGGDEFIILLIETGQKEAFQTAERLRHAIENMDFGIEEGVTISGGVVEMTGDETLEALIERCDDALYVAKNTGRNKIHLKKNRIEE